MTRKDYIKIAAMLRANKPINGSSFSMSTWRGIVRDTAELFSIDNGRFNHKLFYVACDYDHS